METPRRFYLITHPRTASNLLLRILALEDQPDVAQHRSDALGGYFFLPSAQLSTKLGLRGKNVEGWTEDQKNQMRGKLQECFNTLEKYAERAEKDGKVAFVKEHSLLLIEPVAQSKGIYGPDSTQEPPWTVQVPSKYGPELTRSPLNETLFPDQFIRTWLPTFLIRHPALVFPSQYRALMDIKLVDLGAKDTSQFDIIFTFRWIRSLYNDSSEYLGKFGAEMDGENTWPLVLEADDVMLKPEVIFKFSKLVGLNPTKLKFEWKPATDVELSNLPNDMARRMLSTLTASSGIMIEKTSANIDIDQEAKRWRDEFGQETGGHMERWVRAAMPDYEYMRARRLRA